MTTHKYKSDAVNRDVVVKSAVIGLVAGFMVNLPLALTLVFSSMVAGCYDRQDYALALAALPLVHVMTFVVVFTLMTAMYRLIANGNGDNSYQ